MRLLRQHEAEAAAGAADAAARSRAALRTDRGRTELRRGRAVLLAANPRSPGGPAMLAAAIEALDAARWRELQRRGLAWRLLLSRERLQAIGWDFGPAPQSFALDGGLTLEALREFAAAEAVDGLRLVAPHPADAAQRAALRLAVRARLLPALVIAEVDAATAATLRDDEVLALAPDDVPLAAAHGPALKRLVDAPVPLAGSAHARFVVFGEAESDVEHVAVIVGTPDLSGAVPVRLHSACLTGDLFGSLRCDCGEQLRGAVDQLAAAGGVLLYLAQEGRGIGLVNKLRAYRLQDGGLDTFEADRQLGFSGDARDFDVAAAMLHALGIGRVRLYTHNPHKIAALLRAGIEVVDRRSLPVTRQAHNQRYLAAKRAAGHFG